jgi:hypothetical protein
MATNPTNPAIAMKMVPLERFMIFRLFSSMAPPAWKAVKSQKLTGPAGFPSTGGNEE